MATIEVDTSDLEKILDALVSARDFLVSRDTTNSIIHLAPIVRYSPLTSKCDAEVERLAKIIDPNPS